MAAGKENEAPAAPSVAARRLGVVAVRRCALKKRPVGKRWLCRVPLRDITNLVAAAEQEELPALEEDPDQVLTKLGAVLPPPTAGGVAAKAARYSLRKEFR